MKERLIGTWRLGACAGADGAEGPNGAKGAVLKLLAVPRVLAVLSVTLLVAGCSGLSVKSGVYASVDEARAAGAIEHGWVPDGLPPGTSDLREGHLADGGLWGAFSFVTARSAALQARLTPEIVSGTLACHAPGRLEWWPRILHSPIDVGHLRAIGFHVYKTAGLIYAVNWGEGRAYYWRG
jgi:hypothetical protein